MTETAELENPEADATPAAFRAGGPPSQSRTLFIIAGALTLVRVLMWVVIALDPDNLGWRTFLHAMTGLDYLLYAAAVAAFVLGLVARRQQRAAAGKSSFARLGLIIGLLVLIIPFTYFTVNRIFHVQQYWMIVNPATYDNDPNYGHLLFSFVARLFSPFLVHGGMAPWIVPTLDWVGLLAWPVWILASAALLTFGIIFGRSPAKRMPGIQSVAGPTFVTSGSAPVSYQQSTATNGLALASIIVVWFSSIVGLILGHIALSQIKQTGQPGHGMALTAVIVGWVSTGLAVLAVIIYLIVIVAAFGSFR